MQMSLSFKLWFRFFPAENLILACMVTSLDKFRQAVDIKNVSMVVDFIDLYSWDLQGSWNGRLEFGNAIESDEKEILTLVSLKCNN